MWWTRALRMRRTSTAKSARQMISTCAGGQPQTLEEENAHLGCHEVQEGAFRHAKI